MNKHWECYLCGEEDILDNPASGFLGNYHPLCLNCANNIFHCANDPDRFRLTYHSEYGDLKFVNNKLVAVTRNAVKQ
jgi:hypothetical protein